MKMQGKTGKSDQSAACVKRKADEADSECASVLLYAVQLQLSVSQAVFLAEKKNNTKRNVMCNVKCNVKPPSHTLLLPRM